MNKKNAKIIRNYCKSTGCGANCILDDWCSDEFTFKLTFDEMLKPKHICLKSLKKLTKHRYEK